MSASSLRNCSQQRTPLQPRDTPLDENNLQFSSEISCSSSLHSDVHNKRLLCDNLICETENEPLNHVNNKRQRTKSCSDLGLMNSLDNNSRTNFCVNHENELSDIINMGISKKEFRVMPKEESNQKVLANDLKEDLENPHPQYIIDKSYGKESFETFSTGISENVNNDISLLSKCSGSLKYVTQLPEGCCTNADESKQLVPNFSLNTESDNEDIDDDDNYLDSSETEENEVNIQGPGLLSVEDEESCGEDDQSVISSITVGSTCSLRSVASETMSSIYMNENGIASNEDGSLLYTNCPSSTPLNILTCSLFPHVPPTINFCKFDETTEQLPEDIAKVLKWKFTTITPMIVRKSIVNSGFKIIKKTLTWGGTWGKHMKSPCFKLVKEYQKVNHFPGTFQIGRKDKLWKNFAKLQTKFGKEEFGFIPKTFVLPGDLSALKAAFNKEGLKKKWIVKPPASARGTGIQVVDKWSQMPVDSPVVVQRYISRPYLINNTKFDIRLYVLVTSFHPLRIFLYEDGLVRFASVQYQKASKTLSDRFMHLTNYSVNKSSSSYTHNDDAGHCQGHKWTLKTLWGYLKAQDVDTGALWSRIVDIVIKTIISGENEIVVRTKKYTKNIYNCFELFGFDVILDEKLRPWLLEVNISPSLHSASSLDNSVKGPLIADLLNLAGYHIPDKILQQMQIELLAELNLSHQATGLCLDRRIYTRLLTMEEQFKHAQMSNLPRSESITALLENLQPNDVRQLIIAEDQLRRAGRFACVFPTADTHHYFGFLTKVRYYNRLMDAWETTFASCREKGIELLQGLCEKKIHLKVTQRFKLPKTACLPPVGKPLSMLLPFNATEEIETQPPESLVHGSDVENASTEGYVSEVKETPKSPAENEGRMSCDASIIAHEIVDTTLESYTSNIEGIVPVSIAASDEKPKIDLVGSDNSLTSSKEVSFMPKNSVSEMKEEKLLSKRMAEDGKNDSPTKCTSNS